MDIERKIDELAGLVEKKHGETQQQIGRLGDKVDTIGKNQVAIQTKLDESVVRKEQCFRAQEGCRNQVYGQIRSLEGAVKTEIEKSNQTVKDYLAGLVKKNGNGNALTWKQLGVIISLLSLLIGLLVYLGAK